MWAAPLPLAHAGPCSSAHTVRAFPHSTARCRRRPLQCSCRWGASDRNKASAPQRRSALLAALAAALGVQCASPAHAAVPETLQDSFHTVLRAPLTFLRSRQQANGGSKLLAPIRGSIQRLEAALENLNAYDPDPVIYKSVLNNVRSASLNCYLFEALPDADIETRMSLLQRQMKLGDACTFRLIAKNVVALLPPSQTELKETTLTELENLIRSYHLLDDNLDRARMGDPHAAENVPAALQFTLATTHSFGTAIERCLGLPPSNIATL